MDQSTLFQMAWGRVVAKAWSDAGFKERLLADPVSVFKENGIEVPPGETIKIVENSGKMTHLILPERPEQLSDEELDQVAGGLLSPNVLQVNALTGNVTTSPSFVMLKINGKV